MWKEDKVGKYTVKSAYLLLMKATCRSVKDLKTLVWHNLVPLKLAAFARWLTLNRIHSKVNFANQGIIGKDDQSCIGECGMEESVNHLFFE